MSLQIFLFKLPAILEPGIGLLFWNILAFAIAFFILRKFAWPAITKGLNQREANISNSIATAEKVKIEMAQLKNENEALMVQAREERAQMLKDAKVTHDKIVSDAKEKAKVEASKIIEDAKAIINQQKNAALIDLKNQVGNLVVEVSEKVIRRELANKAEQENYIKQLAAEVKLN
jgi:F-type H+-transporting ATPase subunit b